MSSPRARVIWARWPGAEADARWHQVAVVSEKEVTTVCSTVIPAPVDFRADALDLDDIECVDCLEVVRGG